MRTIPNILKYEEVLEDFNSPIDSHAHRINKTSGTKVHMIRGMHERIKKCKKRRDFSREQSKLRAMLLEAGF